VLAPGRRSNSKCCELFTFHCPHGGWTTGIDRNKEITSLSPYAFHVVNNNLRLLVGSPRDGETNWDGNKQGMIYKCRLESRLPLNQVCTPFIGNSNPHYYHHTHHMSYTSSRNVVILLHYLCL